MNYKDKGSKFRHLIPAISLIITFIALIFALITFLIQRSKRETRISVQILSDDELTMYSPEEELNARFTYAGEEVAYLWKVKAKFINSGSKTVIGKGNLKNIISEVGLNFAFLNDMRVLRLQKLDGNFKSSLVKTEANKFRIQFFQWRKNEYIDACFYISSEKQLEERPLIIIPDREIVDGDVFIEDLTKKKIASGLYAIDHLPKTFSMFFKVFNGIVLLGALFVILGISAESLQEKIRFSKWRKKNLDKFKKYLVEIKPDIDEWWVNHYVEFPYILKEEEKKGFKGQKIPEDGFQIKSVKDALIGILTSIIFLIVISSYVSMLIPV